MLNGSRSRAFGLLAAAFVAGAAAGGITLAMLARAGKVDVRPPRGGPGGPGGGGGRGGDGNWTNQYVANLTKQLELTKPQQDSVQKLWTTNRQVMDSLWRVQRPIMDSLFKANQPLIDSLMKPTQEKVDARRLQLRQDIKAVLTPPQQEKYDSLLRAREAAQKMREQGGRGRGDGPSRGFDPGPPRGGMDHDR